VLQGLTRRFIFSGKNYKEVGAPTSIESLDLKRIEERTEKKRRVFSSTTTTSHQVMASSA
jgi:hypothetical protein